MNLGNFIRNEMILLKELGVKSVLALTLGRASWLLLSAA